MFFIDKFYITKKYITFDKILEMRI